MFSTSQPRGLPAPSSLPKFASGPTAARQCVQYNPLAGRQNRGSNKWQVWQVLVIVVIAVHRNSSTSNSSHKRLRCARCQTVWEWRARVDLCAVAKPAARWAQTNMSSVFHSVCHCCTRSAAHRLSKVQAQGAAQGPSTHHPPLPTAACHAMSSKGGRTGRPKTTSLGRKASWSPTPVCARTQQPPPRQPDPDPPHSKPQQPPPRRPAILERRPQPSTYHLEMTPLCRTVMQGQLRSPQHSGCAPLVVVHHEGRSGRTTNRRSNQPNARGTAR